MSNLGFRVEWCKGPGLKGLGLKGPKGFRVGFKGFRASELQGSLVY